MCVKVKVILFKPTPFCQRNTRFYTCNKTHRQLPRATCISSLSKFPKDVAIIQDVWIGKPQKLLKWFCYAKRYTSFETCYQSPGRSPRSANPSVNIRPWTPKGVDLLPSENSWMKRGEGIRLKYCVFVEYVIDIFASPLLLWEGYVRGPYAIEGIQL